MTSKEHIKLSAFIKGVHKKLREEAKILGIDGAWKKHCQDEEILKKYALAMRQLAVNHWDNNAKKDLKIISRVFWVYTACKEYFVNIEKYREKELNIIKSHLKCIEVIEPVIPTIHDGNRDVRYRLLDVGSCYNPFQQFNIFDVVPIDIAPANSEVMKCDFLNLDICSSTIIKDQAVVQLKEHSFDIIVFSLLLEYFPSSDQRLKCCLNAYNLLKSGGILTIVTPDSNHVGSNAKIFKSWRYVLAKHGFIRVKYEKLPYIHCMVFRKAIFKIVAQRWAEIHHSEQLFQEIFIPQDFTGSKEVKLLESMGTEQKWYSDTFLEDIDCTVSD